jgi:prevent-host-death family protein
MWARFLRRPPGGRRKKPGYPGFRSAPFSGAPSPGERAAPRGCRAPPIPRAAQKRPPCRPICGLVLLVHARGMCNPVKIFWKTLDKNIYNSYNKNMVTVGVRDLKNQLSQYLQFVKNGEKVIITEHNKIIAEISSPSEVKDDNILLAEQRLQKLSMEGEIILAKRNETRVNIPETTEN